MDFDIRFPIGLFFGLLGVVLAGYGLVSDPAIYAATSLGVNINLIWGLALLLFGVVTLGLWAAHRARRRGAGARTSR
jgi:hypothetical protein